MNDAGVGKDNAGITGLDFLDRIGLAAATADARTCHIGDGDHILAHGIISYVNRAAAALGCAPGQSVHTCAELMRAATVPTVTPPPITEGARFVMRDVPGEPVLICADSIGMLQPDDAGRIVVTASHGALSGGGRTMWFRLASTRSSSAMPAAAWMERASHASPISNDEGSSRAPPPRTARRLEIPARSTATASCRASTARHPSTEARLA